MESRKPLKKMPLYMYGETDYIEIKNKLPDIIDEAIKLASKIVEPTLEEKDAVMDVIRSFLRDKHRVVYGGTAINEQINLFNPSDKIYKEYNYGDIEFYSSTPIEDAVELADKLYTSGFKYIVVGEAVHDETFKLHVNYHTYCDITYVPRNIYAKIKTMQIDGITYVHPHFAFIDHLRIFNQPLTAGDYIWEKTFPRMYKLLKYYPLQQFNQKIKITPPSKKAIILLNKIRTDYLCNVKNETFLICGFDAYNFYIRQSIKGTTSCKGRDAKIKTNAIVKYIVNTPPCIELISVIYTETVTEVFDYIVSIVDDTSKISRIENAPFFQFTGRSITIMYNDEPIIKIYDTEGMCIPNIYTKSGYNYTAYQYTLMMLFINRFKSFVDTDKNMYYNYNIAISNLICARNNFLNCNSYGVINNTVFGEFRVNCTGKAESFIRASKIKLRENKLSKGYNQFRYEPSVHYSKSLEARSKFDPSYRNGTFDNTSGNILNEKKTMFIIIDNKIVVKHNDESNDLSTHSDEESIDDRLSSDGEIDELSKTSE